MAEVVVDFKRRINLRDAEIATLKKELRKLKENK